MKDSSLPHLGMTIGQGCRLEQKGLTQSSMFFPEVIPAKAGIYIILYFTEIHYV